MALGTALDRDDVRRPAQARLRRRVPYPIADLPAELKSEKLLLFCDGSSAGWHLGAWSDGTWRAAENPDQTLEPTHFALASGLESAGGRWRHATPRSPRSPHPSAATSAAPGPVISGECKDAAMIAAPSWADRV
jgi:hypothetical protein